MEFLADDLLEGREAGTHGYDLAARYVAAALKAAGYAPAGDNGTFFQQVPFVEATQTGASIHLAVNGSSVDLAVPGEALGSVSILSPEPIVTAPVVYAGYGVTAPDFGHDDYAGLDVKGKIVAVLSGAPATLPSEPRAYYAGDSKFRNAAEHGAMGVVTLITEEDAKRYPWAAITRDFGRPQLTRANPDGTPAVSERRLRAGGLLSVEAAGKLFAAAPVSFETAVADAVAGKAGGMPLKAALTFSSTVTDRRTSSVNVVGRLDYFARHPGAAVGRIVANVNLDMPTFLYGTRDIVAFGTTHSTLEAVVERVTRELGYTLSPDPMPEQNLFIRSDQYSFVKQGIPAAYLMPGFSAADPAVNAQQVFGEFLAKHYHKPSDDLSLPMNLAAVEKFTRANYLIAKAIADDPVDPTWKPGSFFGKVFGKKD